MCIRDSVRLEVGSARVTPHVARDLTSWVHEKLVSANLLAAFDDNRAKGVRCVHPLVTLLEKLDALQRRFPNEKVPPPMFVRPTFIVEFPKSVSPLAKSVEGMPEVADRFELYANGVELANGYSELNDPAEQFRRFEDQVLKRKSGDLEATAEIDVDYVRALEYGMMPTAGLGIGIDRLTMLLTGAASIRDVILFPQMKAEIGSDVDPEAGA